MKYNVRVIPYLGCHLFFTDDDDHADDHDDDYVTQNSSQFIFWHRGPELYDVLLKRPGI